MNDWEKWRQFFDARQAAENAAVTSRLFVPDDQIISTNFFQEGGEIDAVHILTIEGLSPGTRLAIWAHSMLNTIIDPSFLKGCEVCNEIIPENTQVIQIAMWQVEVPILIRARKRGYLPIEWRGVYTADMDLFLQQVKDEMLV